MTKTIEYFEQDISEVGEKPALCLSNRDIYERISAKSQPLEKTSPGRHLSRKRQNRISMKTILTDKD